MRFYLKTLIYLCCLNGLLAADLQTKHQSTEKEAANSNGRRGVARIFYTRNQQTSGATLELEFYFSPKKPRLGKSLFLTFDKSRQQFLLKDVRTGTRAATFAKKAGASTEPAVKGNYKINTVQISLNKVQLRQMANATQITMRAYAGADVMNFVFDRAAVRSANRFAGGAAKPVSTTMPITARADKLLEKSSLDASQVYPRDDLNVGPEFLIETRKPLEFKLKPYIKVGFPVFPMLDFMQDAGMDLFSGQIYLGGGVQIPSFIDNGSLQVEAYYAAFKSGEGAGLSELTDGRLVGSTSLKGFGATASHNFYLFGFDYLFFGIGGGIYFSNYDVTYSETTVFIDLQNKVLENTSVSSYAPVALLSLGVDIPFYKNIRGHFTTDYNMLFYESSLGAYINFAFSVAYLL